MAAENKLFSYQGRVYLATRGSAGKPLKPRWLGDATLTIELATETVDHYESFTGQRALYGQLIKSKTANATLTVFEATTENLLIALYGSSIKTTAGAVTAELFPADTAADDYIVLERPFVSNLAISDSAGSAATLVEGDDYILERPEIGLVQIKNITGFTQPFKAAYNYKGIESVQMFTETPPERWLKLDGINTVDNTPVIVDLYRVRFNPSSNMSLHHEEFGSFELSGAVLVDAMLESDPSLGGFGRIIRRAEA
jgi:hypothetical protein